MGRLNPEVSRPFLKSRLAPLIPFLMKWDRRGGANPYEWLFTLSRWSPDAFWILRSLYHCFIVNGATYSDIMQEVKCSQNDLHSFSFRRL